MKTCAIKRRLCERQRETFVRFKDLLTNEVGARGVALPPGDGVRLGLIKISSEFLILRVRFN